MQLAASKHSGLYLLAATKPYQDKALARAGNLPSSAANKSTLREIGGIGLIA
jgi:hypothetical protein